MWPRDEWFVDNVFLGEPQAIISLDTNNIVFDTTAVGFEDTMFLEIQNIGILDFNVINVIGSGGVFIADTTHFTVPEGNHFKLPLIFKPTQTGMYQGQFKIVHDVLNADTLNFALFGVCANITGIDKEDPIPKKFRISQNYPNPFNPITKIYFDLPVKCSVQLDIYDIFGMKVKTLISKQMKAGYQETAWNGTNEFNNKVTSGIYFYRLSANNSIRNFVGLKRMILMK